MPVFSICNKTADAIPGPRPSALFEKVDFPWKGVTGAVREVGSIEAYRLSMLLSREGLICGPSSGMALQGLLDFLEDEKAGGRLQSHADAETGDVSCVSLCCDLPYQYMDKYFEKLTADADFHSIENEELTAVDQGPYSPEWELTLEQAMSMANVRQFTLTGDSDGRNDYIAPSNSLLVDLRTASDFISLHIYGSINKPLDSLASDTESPFDQKSILCAQAKDIESIVMGLSDGNTVPILVVCYSGETSRLACSILRHHGIESYSLKGGIQCLTAN
jgi:cysteine synthase A